ncbi:MAG: hypothetical protein ABIP63_07715 [Thermoanaerobaculia bacterium]
MKLKSLAVSATLTFATLFSMSACSKSETATATTAAETEKATEHAASDQAQAKTGTFTADGKTYTGKVSTQNFEATGQFSVLCQDDSDPNNSKLIQFVFKNEASARAAGVRKIAYDQGKDQTPDEVSMTFDTRYSSDQGRDGSLSVTATGKDNELVFDKVALLTMSKEAVTVSGRIPF